MSDIPYIELGSRRFAVPEFVVKEQRRLVPMLMKCSKINYAEPTEDDIGLLFDVLFEAASRQRAMADGETPITREQFDEINVKLLTQIIPAIKVISEQLGLRPAAPGEA